MVALLLRIKCLTLGSLDKPLPRVNLDYKTIWLRTRYTRTFSRRLIKSWRSRMRSSGPIKPSLPANNLVASEVKIWTPEVKRATVSASTLVEPAKPELQIICQRDRCVLQPKTSCRPCKSNWKENDSRNANFKSISRGSSQAKEKMQPKCERVQKPASRVSGSR